MMTPLQHVPWVRSCTPYAMSSPLFSFNTPLRLSAVFAVLTLGIVTMTLAFGAATLRAEEATESQQTTETTETDASDGTESTASAESTTESESSEGDDGSTQTNATEAITEHGDTTNASESTTTLDTDGADGTQDDTDPAADEGASDTETESASAHSNESAHNDTATDDTEASASGSSSATESTEQSTEDGEDAVETTDTTGGTDKSGEDTAEIDTGDASASTDLEQHKATNDTTVTGADATEVANDNDTTLATDATSDAASGDNAAEARDHVSIDTGNAISTTNVLNVVNTNTFNAHGLFEFLNVLMGNVALDLRELFGILAEDRHADTRSGCDLETETCTDPDTQLTVDNTNNANLNTNVTAGASTAANSGTAGDGTVDINTGDAYAGANVMNVVNTNITNANYLLLTVNGFGGGDADIIFPGADWFYELLSQGSDISAGSQVTMENDNSANVTTTGTITAESGDNTATAPSAHIDTGNTDTSTNILNRVNTNVFGDSISLLFRVSDDWSGRVFGLPDGMNWRQTPAGVEIYLDGTLDREAIAQDAQPLNLVNTNTNNANVNTTFNVFALTGDNMAEAGEEANISTGNAEAGANVMNIVNTNVLGRNWVLAMFNIMGDWNGDISFGETDLWIGSRAITQGPIRSHDCFEYELTVNNFGDGAADDVRIIGRYDPHLQRIEGMQKTLDGRMAYHLGRVGAGASRTFTLPACMSGTNPGQSVDTDFIVETDAPDSDTTNNTDMISVVTSSFTGAGGIMNLSSAADEQEEATTAAAPVADIQITKEASVQQITASSSIEYTVTIENNGPQVNYALLVDTLYDAKGRAVYEERWGLEEIYEGEQVIITYTSFFNASTAPGTYYNVARVTGTLASTTEGAPIPAPSASASIEVVGIRTEDALREMESCKPLLTTYIRRGTNNDPMDVSKLQHFLRNEQDETGVRITGEYDLATYNAVHVFQDKYAADILTPWGVNESTGYVYYTTQKKINELWCMRDFPLSESQRAEIESYKNQEWDPQYPQTPEEPYELIGAAPAVKEEDSDDAVMLAQAAPAPLFRDEDEEDTAQESDITQVAAVSETAEEAAGLWHSIKESVSGLFSWVGK